MRLAKRRGLFWGGPQNTHSTLGGFSIIAPAAKAACGTLFAIHIATPLRKNK